MKTTESRREFEEAMEDKYNLLKNNEGVYLSIETRAALDGWQAARERQDRLIFSIAREWYAILEKGTIYDTTPELRDLLSILPNPPASEKI